MVDAYGCSTARTIHLPPSAPPSTGKSSTEAKATFEKEGEAQKYKRTTHKHTHTPVDECLVIGLLVLLTRQRHTQLLRRIRLPHAHIHVVAAAVHIGGVTTEAHTEHALHALRVIHLAQGEGRVYSGGSSRAE